MRKHGQRYYLAISQLCVIGLLCVFALSCSQSPPLAAAAPTSDRSFEFGPIPSTLGINVKWEWYPTDRLVRELPTHVALLRELGVGWIRMGMIWKFNERRRGVYDFSRQDAVVEAMAAANIGILFILAYDNPLYDGGRSPVTDEGRQAFAAFAEAAVRRYRGYDVAWEIYNEPNWGTFWSPKPNLKDYVALAETVAPRIRAFGERQPLMAPAISGPNVHSDCSVKDPFIKAILAAPVADLLTAISVHPYRKTSRPEDMLPAMDALRCEIDAARTGKPALPVVISEFGYSTYSRGVSEPTQAAYALRFYFSTLSRRLPLAVLYAWQDDGRDANEEEHGYGILRAGRPNPGHGNFYKPAFHALRRMNQHLVGYQLREVLDLGAPAMGLRLSKGTAGETITAYVAWNAKDRTSSIQMPLEPGTWQAVDLVSGATSMLSVEPGTGGYTVSVGMNPLAFIR